MFKLRNPLEEAVADPVEKTCERPNGVQAAKRR